MPYQLPKLKLGREEKKNFFQEDNAPVHTAKIAREFLLSQRMELLPWPAQSPDLNPIDNIWALLEPKLRARKPQPSKRSCAGTGDCRRMGRNSQRILPRFSAVNPPPH
jgi:hypothetical protein